MPTEIVPDVYDVTAVERDGRRIPAYLFDVETPTLVDCGLAETTDTLLGGIAETGIDPERLVVTHADRDHVGGWDAVVEAYDVESYLPEGADPDVDHPPDHRYGDGDRIGRFVAVHVPGHKPDNHALVDEDAGVAVLGDAVSGADQRGLEAGRFHLPPAVYSRDLNLAEESLERLLDYEFDVGLVFHGSSVTEDAHAKLERYVDPT